MIKIAITGPESTGKSTLAEQLAAQYGTVWVPEYARSYVGNLGRPYTLADIENIARGQMALERELQQQANAILFADTDMLVLKIWSEHAFGHTPSWILEQLQQQDYNLCLLMGVDLPWEPDPQREHPHLRQYFYDWYKRELEALQVPFVEISGQQQERLQLATRHVKELLQKHQP
ncbi:ATP-binding protein [Pontibacter anaerobius]|uniref:ATP-binding protein n=1 Tax=Pontibacter anaerobius TaxID=2993940 RepID=A0ABT3R9Z7_9BACT|nr:ATP-binding protein [Pontibacter anaerobius]MCX2738575.1 ATP-binding protein [Pontibacter anaerobius]